MDQDHNQIFTIFEGSTVL